MNKIEPDYNYQVTTNGRSYGRVFLQNRIRQAYKSGMDDGFIEKQKVIKYLEDKIETVKDLKVDIRWNQTEIAYFNHNQDFALSVYTDLLERLKSNMYE